MKNKFLLPIIIVILIMLPNSSHAVLQANGNDSKIQIFYYWPENIRKMEALGGAMGLSEELNDDLTSKTSNNIDVHMEKNTEYGAMAILSASAYGNPNVIKNGDTTTGNKTGVVIKTDVYEWVALKSSTEVNSLGSNFANIAKRYADVYENGQYEKRSGDAIEETTSWHGANKSSWNLGRNEWYWHSICRNMFNYNSIPRNYSQGNSSWLCSRAVVVCGEGL